MHFRPSARIRKQAFQPPSAIVNASNTDVENTWYKDSGLRKMMFWISVILAAQVCTGFDATLTANLQSFKIWKSDMGHPNSSQLGLITAIYFIGTWCGSIPGAIITDKFGRRIGLGVGQFLTIVGAAFQAGSQSRGQYMGARFILGFGIAFTTCAGPTLLSELAHPQMRGTLVSMFNPFWYVGSIIAAWICFGTSHMPTTSHWAWRIPSLLQAVIPCFTLTLIIFMPESPRWLYSQGRKEEALANLARYHANGDTNHGLVQIEMAEIEQAIEQASEGVTWRSLAENKQNRKRLAVVMVMTLMTLWCGQNVITYYFVQVLDSVGITETTQQTAINGGLNIANLISSVTGAFLADRIGRRKLWMSSYIGMIIVAVPFIELSASYLHDKSQGTAYGVIVCLFLYDIIYNIACNPLLYSYPTEIMPFYMRSKGLAIKNITGQTALIINMYVNPIALSAIAYNYYIVFLALNCLWLSIIWMFFPETKGYSLEELAVLFDDEAGVIQGVDVKDVTIMEDGEKKTS